MDFLYSCYVDKKPFGGIAEGEDITIEFPVRFNVIASQVKLIIRDYFNEETLTFPLGFSKRREDYNIYKCTFNIRKAGIYYYRFEVHCLDGIWFIGRGKKGQAIRQDFAPEWQLTIYDKNFVTPDFIKGGIIYHIFVDRFHTSGTLNFRKKGILKSWDKDVTIHDPDGTYLADDFFGGNLQGIIEKLDYLKSLNVTLIYLSPIFESCSNHRYDTGDYMKIDDLLGSEEDFGRLIEEAGKLGIGIMLDGVFNHSGADSIYFNKFGNYKSVGACQSKKSPYYDWYYFTDYPDTYDCWWGITSVPTINKSNFMYRQFLLGEGGVIEKWTKMGIKGWRLDVVDELPIDLVDEIRSKIKSISLDTLIIGEVWEDASVKVSYSLLRPYFTGGQLDGVMNYPFKEAIIRYIIGHNTDDFAEAVMSIAEHYPKKALDCTMNVISTHDTVRMLNVMSGLYAPTKYQRQMLVVQGEKLIKARKRLKIASAIQFMLPGVPSIFYGDEAGLQGYEDPINRRPYPWGNEDMELLDHYRRLGEIRSAHKEAMLGSIRFIPHPGLGIFVRETLGESIAVISNVSGKKQVWTNPSKGVNLLNKQIINEGEIEIDNLKVMIILY